MNNLHASKAYPIVVDRPASAPVGHWRQALLLRWRRLAGLSTAPETFRDYCERVTGQPHDTLTNAQLDALLKDYRAQENPDAPVGTFADGRLIIDEFGDARAREEDD